MLRLSLSFALLALWCASSHCACAVSASLCAFTADNGNAYDFSRLALPANAGAATGNQHDNVAIQICGVTQASTVCAGANASVCLQYDFAPEWFALARNATDAPLQFSLLPNDVGVEATYRNGDYGIDSPTVHVHLFCAEQERPVYWMRHNAPNTWLIVVNSSINCALHPPPPPAQPFQCNYTFADGAHFDFSSVTADGPVSWTDSSSGVDWNYTLNVCGVTSPDGPSGVCAVNAATVCIASGYPTMTWSPLAEWNKVAPVWSEIQPGHPDGGVQLLFQNGAYQNSPATVHLQLFCSRTVGPVVRSDWLGDAYGWDIMVYSSRACITSSSQYTAADDAAKVSRLPDRKRAHRRVHVRSMHHP